MVPNLHFSWFGQRPGIAMLFVAPSSLFATSAPPANAAQVHRVLEEAKLPEVSDEEPGGPDGAPSERPE